MTGELDPLAILSSLGVPPPDRVVAVSGGWDTAIWRVDSHGTSCALRVFRANQAERCRREALVMRALAELGLPVPTVRAEASELEPPVLLLSWCPGRTVLQELGARRWRVWHLARALGRMHALIHNVRLPEAVTEILPVVQVQSPAATDAAASLLHLDYHPLNVMTDGQTVTGVLDWANVAVGDRRADLARTVTLFRLAPTPPGTPAVVQLVLRGLLEAGWRSGYRELWPADPFAHLEPFYVWAGDWMERDLRPKLGQPGVWLRESDLLRIRRWTETSRQRL